MIHMNDLDMDIPTFSALVRAKALLVFSESEIVELWEDGYTVAEALQYGEWLLEKRSRKALDTSL
jgi:hypothetical protein